jgi:hypothetical protein
MPNATPASPQKLSKPVWSAAAKASDWLLVVAPLPPE